jgi:tetratricopeptide (TPR) repeat protein
MRLSITTALVLGISSVASAKPQKPPADPKPAPAKAAPADPAPAAPGSRKPKDDFEAAVFYFQDNERTGWSADRCESAADKFLTAGKGKRAEAFFNAGAALERCGKYGDAEKNFKKALELNPNHAPSLTGLGELAMRNGKYPEAQDLF